jgi:prepilin peptidase dependent protein B
MLNVQRMRFQQGFTLVELMISIGLGIAAVSAIMFFYIANLSSSYTTLKSSKLNQEISTLMTLMVQDIRRAGYGSLISNSDASNNPFSNSDTRLAIYTTGSDSEIGVPDKDDGNASCIVFAYDKDIDLTLDNDDFFGFRLNGSEVEFRVNGTDNKGCEDDNNGWESITDSAEIIVDTLTFSLDGSLCTGVTDDGVTFDCYAITPSSGDRTVETRLVTINISAYLADDSDVLISRTEKIRVRNDHVRIR